MIIHFEVFDLERSKSLINDQKNLILALKASLYFC